MVHMQHVAGSIDFEKQQRGAQARDQRCNRDRRIPNTAAPNHCSLGQRS